MSPWCEFPWFHFTVNTDEFELNDSNTLAIVMLGMLLGVPHRDAL